MIFSNYINHKNFFRHHEAIINALNDGVLLSSNKFIEQKNFFILTDFVKQVKSFHKNEDINDIEGFSLSIYKQYLQHQRISGDAKLYFSDTGKRLTLTLIPLLIGELVKDKSITFTHLAVEGKNNPIDLFLERLPHLKVLVINKSPKFTNLENYAKKAGPNFKIICGPELSDEWLNEIARLKRRGINCLVDTIKYTSEEDKKESKKHSIDCEPADEKPRKKIKKNSFNPNIAAAAASSSSASKKKVGSKEADDNVVTQTASSSLQNEFYQLSSFNQCSYQYNQINLNGLDSSSMRSSCVRMDELMQNNLPAAAASSSPVCSNVEIDGSINPSPVSSLYASPNVSDAQTDQQITRQVDVYNEAAAASDSSIYSHHEVSQNQKGTRYSSMNASSFSYSNGQYFTHQSSAMSSHMQGQSAAAAATPNCSSLRNITNDEYIANYLASIDPSRYSDLLREIQLEIQKRKIEQELHSCSEELKIIRDQRLVLQNTVFANSVSSTMLHNQMFLSTQPGLSLQQNSHPVSGSAQYTIPSPSHAPTPIHSSRFFYSTPQQQTTGICDSLSKINEETENEFIDSILK